MKMEELTIYLQRIEKNAKQVDPRYMESPDPLIKSKTHVLSQLSALDPNRVNDVYDKLSKPSQPSLH